MKIRVRELRDPKRMPPWLVVRAALKHAWCYSYSSQPGRRPRCCEIKTKTASSSLFPCRAGHAKSITHVRASLIIPRYSAMFTAGEILGVLFFGFVLYMLSRATQEEDARRSTHGITHNYGYSTHGNNHDHRKHRHDSQRSAQAERERMQRAHPGDTFNVYQGACGGWFVGRGSW